ncbi:methylmalonyl Co-A mutase-associated GTPase MeaB [Salisediminibacterium halotolerans]|uniref:LAO/AO transport system kinase n=1 Tax=Salisediminibacterium halotolerans TaxID=517425 RepID=A0A1H9QTH9_9BACI|nr:methylmalonyl Co-A mutase-associated GTPase MeaB [Salisediminibacterium haloalkalitolerans]SER63730.1 LAO/AO transport system kinase [Salisediminibacterium haloalkalitolerans]
MKPTEVQALLNGEQRPLARAISAAENRTAEHRAWMKAVYSSTGRAHITGMTGSPGSGKSSLVSGLVKQFRAADKTVGVIAIDPTSPFSGGALLGDRVRLRDHEGDSGVFVRSMGTRGSLGGLSEACLDAVRLMDAAGYDEIVIETVGVGQSELDIMQAADTIALVLYPSGGDVIQAFKAGIMEIADLFVINKADLPGVPQLKSELEDLLHLTKSNSPWQPPVIEAVATEQKGIEALAEAIGRHRLYLAESGEKQTRRKSRLEAEVTRRVTERAEAEWRPFIAEAVKGSEENEADPYDLADEIYRSWRKKITATTDHHEETEGTR